MTDRQLAQLAAATLPEGTGVSVYHELLWDVVLRMGSDGTPEYIVTQLRRDEKPLRVYGPVQERSDAEGWAKLTATIFRAEKIQMPQWPWE